MGGPSLYGEAQVIMGNGHMGTPQDRMTDTHTSENITFLLATLLAGGDEICLL